MTDLQRGRRVLFQMVQSIEDAQALFQDRREDSDLANRALAMLDVAALYVERGYIDRDLFVSRMGVHLCFDLGAFSILHS